MRSLTLPEQQSGVAEAVPQRPGEISCCISGTDYGAIAEGHDGEVQMIDTFSAQSTVHRHGGLKKKEPTGGEPVGQCVLDVRQRLLLGLVSRLLGSSLRNLLVLLGALVRLPLSLSLHRLLQLLLSLINALLGLLEVILLQGIAGLLQALISFLKRLLLVTLGLLHHLLQLLLSLINGLVGLLGILLLNGLACLLQLRVHLS
jgi:hypothetical protein